MQRSKKLKKKIKKKKGLRSQDNIINDHTNQVQHLG